MPIPVVPFVTICVTTTVSLQLQSVYSYSQSIATVSLQLQSVYSYGQSTAPISSFIASSLQRII